MREGRSYQGKAAQDLNLISALDGAVVIRVRRSCVDRLDERGQRRARPNFSALVPNVRMCNLTDTNSLSIEDAFESHCQWRAHLELAPDP